MTLRPELIRRAQEYSQRKGLIVAKQLGAGVHGIVLAAESQTESGRSAIKVHEREPDYCRERDINLPLKEHGVATIRKTTVTRPWTH